MKLTKLFEAGKIGKMEVRNRIIMPAMGTSFSNPEGYVTDRLIGYYEARAKGGVGLIITEVAPVLPESRPLPHLLGIHDDSFIPGLKKLVQSLKIHGPRVLCQIVHFGIRVAELNPNLKGVGPSGYPHPLFGTVPRELSRNEIRLLVQAYAEAARRAIEAGYDGVEIHGAHGYLLNQFLSPWTNRREDEYGGNVQNRARFACEVISKIRERIGSEFPILFRMNGDDGYEGGIRISEAVLQAPLLVEAGADALHVSAGAREGIHWQFPTLMQPSGCLTHLADAIKKVVPVPIITVGKIGDPLLAERILQDNKADFIAMGRALIADPELPNKAKIGKLEDICPCIYCNACRDRRWTKKGGMEASGLVCAVNTTCGREWEYRPNPPTWFKKVMVIGGGLAGMQAAKTLSERGHQVSLYEKYDSLGGQWNILSAYQSEVASLTRYLSRGLERAGTKVFLNQKIDKEATEAIEPDAVVVATGAAQVVPNILGIRGKNVVLANDVLSGKIEVGQKAVIIGGRMVGLDTACLLAKQGKQVSVVTRGTIARDLGMTFRLAFREYLVNHGVYLYPFSVPVSISETGVNIINDGEIIFLKADTVIIALGSKADNVLAKELKDFVSEVFTIGDCVEPRNAFEAIHEGSEVGCAL